MINVALSFLRDHLKEHLHLQSGVTESVEDKAVFASIAADGGVSFKDGAVTIMLINIEEDRTMRPPDPYRRRDDDGTIRRVHPEVPMSLYVLFVARFGEYEQALVYLSKVIRHFQVNRVLNRQNAPTLDPGIGQLTMELHTLTMQQQNDMWSMIKAGYHPSVLYRVNMVVIRDEDAIGLPVVREIERRVS